VHQLVNKDFDNIKMHGMTMGGGGGLYAVVKHGTISVVTLPIVGRFSLQKMKLSELLLVLNAEPNTEV
jgi:hypothetical protein